MLQGNVTPDLAIGRAGSIRVLGCRRGIAQSLEPRHDGMIDRIAFYVAIVRFAAGVVGYDFVTRFVIVWPLDKDHGW